MNDSDIVDRLAAELAAIQPGTHIRTDQIKGALIDAIYEINLLRGKLRWIPVAEQPPPHKTPLFVLLDGKMPDVGELRLEHPLPEDTFKPFFYWECPNHEGVDWEGRVTHYRKVY